LEVFDKSLYKSNTTAVLTYHIRWMSSFCCGSQYSAEADWVGECDVTVRYVMWWRVSVEGHIRGRKKGFVVVYIFCVWYYCVCYIVETL
jgi:hypothetical protein